jgi:hypothetical protein
MGVFAEWQPRYAEHGIATFPVDDHKKPLVTRYDRIGIKASGQLALGLRFEDCRNLGFMAGKRSNMTIVDVDTDDEAVWREAERVFGPTPLWVRTGRGHLQMWYRHNGEARDTQSRFLGCVDILGGGQVLGFPSRRGQGYEAIRGGLDDLDQLPVMRGLDRLTPDNAEAVTIKEGSRHSEMLKYLRREARHCDDLDQLIDVGTTYADERFDRNGGHQFTDEEIERQAKSVWRWTQEQIANGTYFVGTGRHMTKSFEAHDAAIALGPYAFTLSEHLKRQFGGMKTFYIANDMRHTMPGGEWPRRKFTEARAALVQAGIIKEIHPASSFHGPAVYAWN